MTEEKWRKAYDEAIKLLEEERAKNAASAKTIEMLSNQLEKCNQHMGKQLRKQIEKNPDVLRFVEKDRKKLAAELKARGHDVENI